LNKQLDASTDEVPFHEYSNYSMAHDGICFRNSKHGPAIAEEHQAARMGIRLLLDQDGKYVGNDRAIFVKEIHADNDTRSPAAMIKEQNKIIGPTSNSKASYSPDFGHIIKNCNNEMYKLKATDRSYEGVRLLSNTRITSIHSDIRSAIKDYHARLGDDTARNECIQQISAMIPHHCGDHSLIQIQNEHKNWTTEQIQLAAATKSKCHGGQIMQLSDEGRKKLSAILTKRFNLKNIDQIAKLGCSNLCEAFWGLSVKLTEGKRLNTEHTDLWESFLEYTFCIAGDNSDRTDREMSNLLNLVYTTEEENASAIAQMLRLKSRARINSPEGRMKRSRAKGTKKFQMGKIDAKLTHRSGKVPLKETASASITHCLKCKMSGHSSSHCPMPKMVKRRRKDVNWYSEDCTLQSCTMSSKRNRKLQ
jgi:hypothetical protein